MTELNTGATDLFGAPAKTETETENERTRRRHRDNIHAAFRDIGYEVDAIFSAPRDGNVRPRVSPYAGSAVNNFLDRLRDTFDQFKNEVY